MSNGLTHLNENREAHMVDIGGKTATRRSATAAGWIALGERAREALEGDRVEKGNVLAVARVAGIQAAKQTGLLIPLCHPLALSHVRVDFDLDHSQGRLNCRATAATEGATGVEMEALTAVSTALLTVYDMLKAVDKQMVIGGIHLAEKTGGKSGPFRFDPEALQTA